MKPLVQLQAIKKGKEEVNETHETNEKNEKTARRPAGSDYGASIWSDSISSKHHDWWKR